MYELLVACVDIPSICGTFIGSHGW